MKLLILVSALISLFVTLKVTKLMIKYLTGLGLTVKDMNKKDTPLVPISGGLAVLTGLFSGLMFYIFVQTFFYDGKENLIYFLAAMASILIITFIGFIDDLSVKLDHKKGIYLGLKQWQKPLLTIFAAIPLMVINAGTKVISIAPFGELDLSLIYPLLIIPVGVVGAANMVNLLEGYNGIATGMGIVYTANLGLFAYVNGRVVGAVIAFIACGALLAFYKFNKFPAKILPGDSLTYLLGAILATIAILGNIEKAALIISIPFFVELFLKARGRFKKQSYGYYYKDGKVKSKYKRIYSIPHIFARTGKYSEKQITHFMILIAIFFSALVWLANPIQNYIIVNYLG